VGELRIIGYSLKTIRELFTFACLRGLRDYMALDRLHIPLPFQEIMQRHEREIMRYLLRVSGNFQDAADLFQETWLRAYRAYPRLEAESLVRPWLYAIASNLCRNRKRDSARHARVVVSNAEHSPPAEAIGNNHRLETENEGYATVHIRELISELPAKQQQALHLRYFAGLGYAAIATAMGCSEESARANVSQAMRKIKARW
jgi:RNA polymerase sigma-70 factor, ECF subfamily